MLKPCAAYSCTSAGRSLRDGDDGMYAWIVDLEVDGDRVTKLDSFPDLGD